MDDDPGAMIISMEMELFASPNMTDFLFKGWDANSGSEFFVMCLAMALLTFFLEGLKTLQDHWAMKQKIERTNNAVIDRQALLPDYRNYQNEFRRLNKWHHVAQTCIMALQVAVGYLLMLAVMSYNAWIIITVCASSAVSYFIFALVRYSVRWSLHKNLNADNVVDQILRSVSS